MILHQASPHKLVPPLGSRDHPIPIDVDSQEERKSRYSRPNTASKPPPVSVSSRPNNISSRKGSASMWHIGRSTSQIVTTERVDLYPGSITPIQDVMEAESLKRKRSGVDDFEEDQAEATKKIRKAEKKRRKRERRAARIAQLADKLPSTPRYMQGLNPSKAVAWGAPHQSSPIHLNFSDSPDHSSWGLPTPGGPRYLSETTLQLPNNSSFSEPSSFDIDADEDGLEHSSERDVESLPFALQTETRYPVLRENIHLGRLSMPQHTENFLRPIPPEKPFTTIQSSTTTPISHSARHLDSLNLDQATPTPLQNIVHLDNDLRPAVSSSCPQNSLLANNSTTLSVNAMIVSKQKLLDCTISENKETLEQLGVPISSEQKASLMQTFAERNKLITQLTSEIKAHFATLKSVSMHPSDAFHPLKHKWPETQFPLYVILSSDDEGSDSGT